MVVGLSASNDGVYQAAVVCHLSVQQPKIVIHEVKDRMGPLNHCPALNSRHCKSSHCWVSVSNLKARLGAPGGGGGADAR